MTCGIYEIINKKNNTSYIGQSIDIEKRWKAHLYMNPLNTNNNLKPTLQLANENPDLVDFKILKSFCKDLYTKEEMKFILSLYEKHEVELRGGVESDKVINVNPIHIPEVNPLILNKYSLPDFVNYKDVVNSFEKWCQGYEWRKMREPNYKELHDDLLNRNIELSGRISELEMENSPKKQMSRDYELFKLKQRVAQLEDEKFELEERVEFWKNRCTYWREMNGE